MPLPADFMVINYRAGGTPILQQYSTTVTNYGNSFGALDTGTGDENVPFNRVVRFVGQKGTPTVPFPQSSAVFDTLYAVASDTVYRTFDLGTTWQAVYVLSPMSGTTTVMKSGLNIVYINGQPALTIMWRDSVGALWYGAYSYDGVNWTKHGGFSIGAATVNGMTSDTVYNNVVYSVAYGTTSVVFYDPGAGFMQNISLPGNAGNAAILCEYNRKLYCMFYLTSASAQSLAEISSNQATVITNKINGNNGNYGTGTMNALFVDPNNNKLYGIFYGGTGLVAFEWDSTLGTPTDITSTVLPTSLSTSGATGRILALVDGVSVSGAPQVWLYYATSGSSAVQWNFFLWQGPNQQIFQPSVALGSAADALPANREIAGQYFWYPGSPYTMITGRTYLNNSGGIRLTLRLFGSSAATNAFRAFFATADEEYPTRPCTLSNPTTGTLQGSTVVRNVSGTNSGTFFQVTWLASSDGLTNGDKFKLVCEEFLI